MHIKNKDKELSISFNFDETCNEQVKANKKLDLVKEDIFTYGVFNYEIPPEKIRENAFDYLNSKIPGYSILYNDHIEFDYNESRIINKATGEMARDVSELIGVGVGIKSAIQMFNFRRQDVARIEIGKKKEKRLDFKLINNKKAVEIETKSTAYNSNVNNMIDDVHKKKENKDKTWERYGFVTETRKTDDHHPSVINITDPETEEKEVKKDIYYYGKYYLSYLMFMLDNPDYNKIIKKLTNRKNYKKYLIKNTSFKYHYGFNNKEYLGQCFDKRLLIENILKYFEGNNNVTKLFYALTENVGKQKYFLGIDSELISYLNNKDIENLENYRSEDLVQIDEYLSHIQFSDGILFITSNIENDIMDELFPEEEVKERLEEYFNFKKNEKHPCGAICRSREKEGKSCEIMTYRKHCHFHR